ncbi:PadR family transcriptional regulator [Rhodococcus sp. P1Y]|uniref:PadR family transcriptional regulator n=1 Tax=Rhodococcus sp. P1Y TaxID=1302308 RepID=UPI000EB0EAE3|nr:PadR family transcriptional regulator [Rhodococcus sp. P1Y]AYJ48323.1 PadR family transcriptional regulator [Rhodococcus sp. P1Y]
MAQSDPHSYPTLPATSWAVLGMLTFGEELTGSDLKEWADWSIGFFYWSPSVSQVYTELKKLETQGFVSYRDVAEHGERGRRMYSITDSGLRAVTAWSRLAPVEDPVLKHSVLLRMWMGHLHEPEHLKVVLEEHITNMEDKKRRAAEHADHSKDEPGWAYSRMSLLWAGRYCQAEIDLARDLIELVDDAAEHYARSTVDPMGMPRPIKPGRWKHR